MIDAERRKTAAMPWGELSVGLGVAVELALRLAIGAVFQDYVPWQMPARDNIGMSDLAGSMAMPHCAP